MGRGRWKKQTQTEFVLSLWDNGPCAQTVADVWLARPAFTSGLNTVLLYSLILRFDPWGMNVHAWDPSAWEVGAGNQSGLSQPGLQETLSKETNSKLTWSCPSLLTWNRAHLSTNLLTKQNIVISKGKVMERKWKSNQGSAPFLFR